jgi:mono/diheme cytochrome c family protein
LIESAAWGGAVKQFFLGVLLTITLLAAGGFLFLRFGFAEVRGDVPPSKLETYFMSTAVHASVRRHAEEIPNPVEPTEENLIAGGKMYLGECSGCHGTPGKIQKDADSLRPAPPQLAVVGTEYSEAQIFWVAKHGIRMSGMFANGVWDSDQKLWTVAAYIKRMKNLPPRVKVELDKAANGPG